MPVPFVQLLAFLCFLALFVALVILVALLMKAIVIFLILTPTEDKHVE